jgi:hypothetical protein
MELAIEKVAPSERDEFLVHHRAWGAAVRIADVEIVGTHRKSSDAIEVLVHVSWYRPEENELKQTTIVQTWNNVSGWLLAQEKRAEGDSGLLGEADIGVPRAESGAPARFPTIRLRGGAPD